MPTPPPEYTIGIDIGGTKICGALVSESNSLLNFHEVPTPREPEAFLQTLIELTQDIGQQLLQESVVTIRSVGIATAGIVDTHRGRVIGSTGNLPGIRGLNDLQAIWARHSPLHLHLENDANAAAYGELVAGAAKGCRDLLMVTLGTGVGVGFVVEGHLVRGAHYSAGEGGHMAVSMHRERLCTCGKWDCWETYASGTGLAQTAQRMLHHTPNAQYSKMVIDQPGGIDAVTTHQVITAWRAGDPLATEIMDAWHTHISVGLGSLINILDPERVVIGGGMAQFVNFPQLIERTRPRMMLNPSQMPDDLPSLEIVPAQLGNRAGLVGAAALARMQLMVPSSAITY